MGGKVAQEAECVHTAPQDLCDMALGVYSLPMPKSLPKANYLVFLDSISSTLILNKDFQDFTK